jgi:fatty acid desaturase
MLFGDRKGLKDRFELAGYWMAGGLSVETGMDFIAPAVEFLLRVSRCRVITIHNIVHNAAKSINRFNGASLRLGQDEKRVEKVCA